MKSLFTLFIFGLISSSAFATDIEKLKSDSVAHLLYQQMHLSQALVLVSDVLIFNPTREIHQLTFQQGQSDGQSESQSDGQLGQARVLLSGPFGFMYSKKSYPVLFVSAGFQTGMQSISFIKDPGEIILMGYNYPATIEEMLSKPEKILQSFYQTIGQTVGLWQWVGHQFWLQPGHLDTLGVSFGSLFTPLNMRVAELQGTKLRKVIFAFGGADITSVFANQFRGKIAEDLLQPLLYAINNASSPFAPRLHLPYLKGSFLVIRGLQDQVFPSESGELLEELLPSPKKFVHLDTKHINSDTPEIIELTVEAIQNFLKSP